MLVISLFRATLWALIPPVPGGRVSRPLTNRGAHPDLWGARHIFALVTEACVVSAGSAGFQPADGRGQHVCHQQCVRPHTCAGWKPALPADTRKSGAHPDLWGARHFFALGIHWDRRGPRGVPLQVTMVLVADAVGTTVCRRDGGGPSRDGQQASHREKVARTPISVPRCAVSPQVLL